MAYYQKKGVRKMKRITISFLIGCVILAALAVPALAKGGSSKGSDIWWYDSGDPGTLFKAIYKKTGSGIIHQRRYLPENLHLIFKPESKFPNTPDEGGYFSWTFDESICTDADDSPGSLSDFFTHDTDYWVKIITQD